LAIGSGIVLGLYIVWQVGWPILVLGLVGVFSGYLYVVHLAPRGLGEFAVLVNFGPLMVLGSYYAQTGLISGEALLVSIPVGLLIAAVLWINEVSDYEADRTAAKNTLVVRLGRRRAVNAYLALIISSYALIVLLSLLEITPLCAAISLVSLPIAIRSIRLARHHSTEPSRMVGANAGTVMIHASTGLLLALSYPICSWIQPLL
jgi:1,4-dihydroxy-2-naphthoate octaprenyltransferase